MTVEISLKFLAIVTCSGGDTQDGSSKKSQGGFDFHNQDKSVSYNGTAGSYVIDDSSASYKFNKQVGELSLNGATVSGTNSESRSQTKMPDTFNGLQAGSFGWNAANGSSARGNGHPHIPRSDPNWGVQHFHFANGPHPIHELSRQMSSLQMNMYHHMPVPYPQMGQPPQMSVPHPQINRPPHMSVHHPHMEQPSQSKQLRTAAEKEPRNKPENAWTVDSDENEGERNDTQPHGQLG